MGKGDVRADRGDRELRRKWELKLRKAGAPPARVRKRDSVTDQPLWPGAVADGSKIFKGTPPPEKPEIFFDRWQFDPPFQKGKRLEDARDALLEKEEPTQIQGKVSLRDPRYKTPEWVFNNIFVQLLVARTSRNPGEAELRNAVIYLRYRCGYPARQIAEELSDSEKVPLTEGQIKQCLRRLKRRAKKDWPKFQAGQLKHGARDATRMVTQYLKMAPSRKAKAPVFCPPMIFEIPRSHTIGERDMVRAFGGMTIFTYGERDKLVLRRYTKEDPLPRSIEAIKADGNDLTAREFIQCYGDAEATKFDLPGYHVAKRDRAKDGQWPVVPMTLVREMTGRCVLWNFSSDEAVKIWRSRKDSAESLKKQINDFTVEVNSHDFTVTVGRQVYQLDERGIADFREIWRLLMEERDTPEIDIAEVEAGFREADGCFKEDEYESAV